MSVPEAAPAGERPCQLHATHRPAALVTVKHHVQPLGMGGADDPGNWSWVCDTGHRNVHTLMGPLANDGAMPPGGTRTERALARAGVDRWIAAGRPGNPHAAYGVVDHGTRGGSQ